MFDEISYLYDEADHVAVFLIDHNGENLLGVPSRLKSAWNSFDVRSLSPWDYHEVINRISQLFPEDQQLASLMVSMEHPACVHYMPDANWLWGGLDPKARLKFIDCQPLGQFAKGISRVLTEADEQGLKQPLLAQWLVPDLNESLFLPTEPQPD